MFICISVHFFDKRHERPLIQSQLNNGEQWRIQGGRIGRGPPFFGRILFFRAIFFIFFYFYFIFFWGGGGLSKCK